MGIEIEKKYRLDKRRLVDVTARLRELGAVFGSEVFEENYLHRGGDLEEKAAVLRLRKIGDRSILTYKERLKNDSDVKHRIEHETEVADVQAMERIIESLGYTLSVVYEKHRETWHFRDVEVEWVEEGPGGKLSKRLSATGIIFREVQAAYDLDWHPAPRRQYIINLDAGVQITASDGESRRIGAGEVILVEDVWGKGHLSKALDGKLRHCIFVPIE